MLGVVFAGFQRKMDALECALWGSLGPFVSGNFLGHSAQATTQKTQSVDEMGREREKERERVSE